jgi:Domain of unknown function (DUF4132)
VLNLIPRETPQVWLEELQTEIRSAEKWHFRNPQSAAIQKILAAPCTAKAAFVVLAARKIGDVSKSLGKRPPFSLSFIFDAVTNQEALAAPAAFPLKHASRGDEQARWDTYFRGILVRTIDEMGLHTLPFSDDQLAELLNLLSEQSIGFHFSIFKPLVRASEKRPLSGPLRKALGALQISLLVDHTYSEKKKLAQRISVILDGPPAIKNAAAGPWTGVVLREIEDDPLNEKWLRLFAHCMTLGSADPSRKWLESASHFVAELDRQHFRRSALRWLALGPSPSVSGHPLPEGQATLLRGFLWHLAAQCDAEVCAAIAPFAESCFRKIPNIGAISHRVGNACVNVLAQAPGLSAIGQLVRLRMRLKYNVPKQLVEKALNAAAERQGLSRDDLEEIATPDFGLSVPGTLTRKVGDSSAKLSIVGATAVDIEWQSSTGKLSRTIPAALKRDHPAAIKELRQLTKNIEQMLTAQRLRLEKMYISDRRLAYQQWLERYLNHPLLAHLARRLIWRFESAGGAVTGIWSANQLVSWSNDPLALSSDTSVHLWHPLHDPDVQTALSWRCWLEDHQVTQPFKQAHREVYILTDAERLTHTHSNRFAAHILAQHALNALCRERGWEYRLRGAFDSGFHNPTLALPSLGLKAEFFVEESGHDDLSASGISLHVSTDQVRFFNADGNSVPLETIPPLVFSEALRDVDLFVGVTSLGNDPNWGARGDDVAYAEYWQQVSFGDLSAIAHTRKVLLQNLIPKLKIRDKCSIDDKFLLVRGSRCTYKIHLGSGNILMEPGSRYLCIVPAPSSAKNVLPGSAQRVFLPFESDRTLSIILSKAFLLAADASISDPVILRQLPPT